MLFEADLLGQKTFWSIKYVLRSRWGNIEKIINCSLFIYKTLNAPACGQFILLLPEAQLGASF
jgi:hypothetical protein